MQSKNTATNNSAPTNNPDSSEEEGAVLPPAPSSPTSEALSIESEGILSLNNNSPSNRVDWDLRPCTREAFLSHSFPKEEKCELIDGLLCAQPTMVDDQHQRIIKFLIFHVLTGFVKNRHEFDCYEVMVEPGSPSGSSPPDVKRPTCFYPDLVVAKQIPGRIEMGKYHFCKDGAQPAAAIEVTSEGRARAKDFTVKKKYYAKRGIAEYMIIDRDKVSKSKKRTHVPDQKVIVYTLNDKRQYEGKEYRGTEEVRSRFFDGITAEEMLSPSCPSGELRKMMKALEEERAEIVCRKDEKIRQNDEKIRQKDEKIRQNDEKIRQKDEKIRQKDEEIRQRDEELRLGKQKMKEMQREIERLRRRGSKESDDEVKKGKEKRRKLEDSGGTARRGSAAGEHSKKVNRS